VVGDHHQRQRHQAVDLGHILVINLLPVIADPVIIGIGEGDAERVRGHALIGPRLIVAAAEIGIAVALVLVNVDPGQTLRAITVRAIITVMTRWDE
jgi:hypothetical protein